MQQEEDPTAIDPNEGEPAEDTLPPKPDLDPDADTLEPHEDPGEQDVPEEEVMGPTQAADDPTVDDQEADEAEG